MKKVSILLFFAVLLIGATSLLQCGGDDKNVCEQFAEKVADCLKTACNNYKDCAACKCILDPKAAGCTPESSGTTTTAKCEGDYKKMAEEKLNNFKCEDYTVSIDYYCKQTQ